MGGSWTVRRVCVDSPRTVCAVSKGRCAWAVWRGASVDSPQTASRRGAHEHFRDSAWSDAHGVVRMDGS